MKVVDGWDIDEPRTKRAIEVLEGLGLRVAGERHPRVLLVLDRDEVAAWKSFRNLGKRVQILLPEELNAYDILVNDWIVFSNVTLDAAVTHYSGGSSAVDEGDDVEAVEVPAPAAADEPVAADENDEPGDDE